MVRREEIVDRLVGYAAELSLSAKETNYAHDRPAYEKHLAHAARMLAALSDGEDLAELKRLVDEERHGFGWSYLSGEWGQRTESAFDRFATWVESLPNPSEG